MTRDIAACKYGLSDKAIGHNYGKSVPVSENSVNTVSVYHCTHKCSRIITLDLAAPPELCTAYY